MEFIGGNADRFATSSAFEIVPGAPYEFAFITTPSEARSDIELATQPVLEVRDIYHNPVRDANTSFVASIEGAPLGMRVTASEVFSSAQTGRVTFTDLKISGVADGYTLKFTAKNIGQAINGKTLTTSLTLKHGIASKISLAEAAGAKAGQAFATTAVVRILDGQNNLVTENFNSNGTDYNDANASVIATINDDAIEFMNKEFGVTAVGKEVDEE